jgi:hypothetical protein
MNKLIKAAIAVIFCFSVSLSVNAQSADDAKAVKGVIDSLFSEMAASNPAGILALQRPESQLVAIARGKDGKNQIQYYSAEAFSKFFTKKDANIEEKMYSPKTEVDGDVAMYWGRYVFFVDGKISHCGLNTFHLVRTTDGWKIAGAASTIDPTACTKKEKAMKPTPKK